MADPDFASPRMERVLDTAADLLVRWGYQRVTIDEVARHAGIGKGTVYLHFHNKEALFLTVLLRAQRQIVAAMADRMEAVPDEVLLSRLLRGLYLVLSNDAIARVLYMGDAEVLGRLAHEAADTLGALVGRRREVLTEHLRLLSAAGCLRSDLSPEALLYTFSAIGTGFFFVGGMPGGTPDLDVETRADLLEHAIATAIQVPDPAPAALAKVAPVIAALYRSLITDIDHEVRRRIR
ncbi:TetR/AcrR family transcriptional regulator [Pseudonocardia alaniniphila]|uniref:TetR/AcrR family transcriptional regulator n=1 Tax=Pseudonocardia alaniniphila TaxID=75291 RepID=A0ABS9TBE5_9PSEU|nr:TetR/AcrR family transcriptional regulator [Pseudonocardia alaniniphila]MCH6165869.1 TetR/AcrR family transcriptional regulator [Pseudonocardia alaniniphila]